MSPPLAIVAGYLPSFFFAAIAAARIFSIACCGVAVPFRISTPSLR